MVRIAHLGLVSLLLALPLAADEWPKPPENWWADLKPKTKAVFHVNSAGGQTLRQEVVVEKVDVEKKEITLSTQLFLDDKPFSPKDTRTFNAEDDDVVSGALPADATCTKGQDETIQVGEQEFACTIYSLTVEGVTLKAWHCPALPPVFHGGNVKLEREVEGKPSTVVLVEYHPGE